MIEYNDIVAVGKFQKTHALKGELNALLDVDSDFLNEDNALIVDVDGIYVPFFVISVRPKGSHSFLIKIDGIDSEEGARQFVNKDIYALKSQLMPFLQVDDEDLIGKDDLIGFTVTEAHSGSIIGSISHIDASTENLLFVVKTQDGDEIFIPAVEEFIRDVDDANKNITMVLPEGLLELNKKKESE